MERYKRERPTVGVLVGYQVYEGAVLHPFLRPVFRGICSAARDRGCNLLLACGIGPPTGPGEVRPAWPVLSPTSDFVPVGPWNTDGLIVVPPFLSADKSRYIRQVVASGHPVVFIGPGEGRPAVMADNEGGIREAVAHLALHGHRRILFVAGYEGEESGDSLERRRAYLAAVRESGLEVDERLMVYGLHNRRGGYEATRQVLGRGIEFGAVLASNDESAFGVLEALAEAGVKVPEEVAVVGFDDRLEAVACEPPLTTVRYPSYEVGYEAVELLSRRMGGARGEDEVRVASRLVVRQSCGCVVDGVPQVRGGRVGEEVREELARRMARVVLGEARRLGVGEVEALCRRLVEAFASGLERDDEGEFRAVLGEALRRVETVEDEAHAWQAAVSVLESGTPLLSGRWRWARRRRRAAAMLRWARIAISESGRRVHARYLVQQADVMDQLGWVTARLLMAQDEAQIVGEMKECLPRLDIRHADVVFFEQEGDDWAAWGVLRTDGGMEEEVRRFPTWQFPPERLYPVGEPFRLALLPLVIQKDSRGFVVFDADNLGPCGAIVRQLAAALRSARLYQEAVEGQRLAEEASRLKSRFLSTVSHELRTPLNLVMGLSEMLLEEDAQMGPLPPEQYRRDVERIHASAQHLDSLISDVLDLARSEVGGLRLRREPLDLGEVLESVAAVGKQMARDKGLRWRFEAPGGRPRVFGDCTRLRQVMLNLVANAVKFTSEGEVALRARVGEGWVTVVVCDTGVGIPPKEQEAIFDEFRQSERTAARGYGGLGLGLAICRRLVELHGGKIWVESSGEEGDGSTFIFTLPVMREAWVETGEAEALRAGGQTVLLLTEQASGGEWLQRHLERQFFEVEALWVDETADWLSQVLAAPPGAVVLDFQPASERGWEALKALKGNPATQGIPVVFYSLSAERDSGAMLEMDYLTKPMGTADLARVLERQGLRETSESGERIKTILVVDDEPGVLEMNARIVQTQLPQCRVLQAQDGREALEVVRHERPDLVLLDLMMPELDGFGVLEAMQVGETTRDIPVVVLTGRVLTEEDMERLNRGVAAVLGKGLFSVEETLAHVEAALARRQRLGGEARRIVRRAMAYIHERFVEKVSRDDVARHVGVNGAYLSECFREETGVTFTKYLNRYRVNRAKELLAAGEKSVTEVAMEVGFSSGAYFSRVFRRETGLSPSVYRRGDAID